MKPHPSVRTHIHINAFHVFDHSLLIRIISTYIHSHANSSLSHPNNRPLICCLIALLLLGEPVSTLGQTSIVVRKTPKEIVIAADSLRTMRKRGEITGSKLVCKIVHLGSKMAFASSGFAGFENAGVDIKGMALKSSTKDWLQAKADAFIGMALQPLTDSLEHLRQTDPDSYRGQTTLNGIKKSPTEVVFVSIEDGVPAFVAVSFQTTNSLDEPVVLAPKKASSDEFPSTEGVALYMGHHDAIDPYIGNIRFWNTHTPVTAVRMLVAIMKKRKPDIVGGPIVVLRMTKGGHTNWIGPHPQCPDIEQPTPRVKAPQIRKPRKRVH